MKKLIIFLCGLLLSHNVQAVAPQDIKKIEDYLNSLNTMKATFVQMASNGATAEGRLFIKKPNKIRMEYAEPTNVLIVGNGDLITYKDIDLDQITNIDYKDIPLSLILGKDIKLEGKNRTLVKDFINAKSTKEIVFTGGTTDSLNRIVFGYFRYILKVETGVLVSDCAVENNCKIWGLRVDQEFPNCSLMFL